MLRATLDSSERTALVNELADLVVDADPRLGKLSPEEQDEVVEALKKKDETRLRSFGSSTLARYLITSVDPPATSPT